MSLTRSVPPVEANYNDLDHRVHRIYRAAGAPKLKIVGLRHKKGDVREEGRRRSFRDFWEESLF
jgi:hypothetical protein